VTGDHWENDRLDLDRGRGERSSKALPKTAVNRIALSRAITFSGGNAAFIALLFVLYRETNSAGVAALGALACFAVPALASPVAGWLGDRFDRRKVMVTSELVGAACFLFSAAVSSAPAELLILRVLASLAAAPLMSATAAALPGVVRSREHLPAANAKLTAAGISGGFVGPLLAALLIAISGPASVFLFNTVTFLISAALLVSINADFRPSGKDSDKGALSDLAAGFRYLGQHHLLRPVTLAYGIIFIGVGLTAPAEVALSSDFDAGATGYAALTCVFALGGIAGTRFAARGLLQRSVAATAILAAASGALAIGFLVVGFAPVFIIVLAGMAVAGAADGIWMVAHENLVQRVTPDDIRSRVFAGSEAIYLGGISIGIIAAGGLISAFSAAGTFQFGAAVSVLACVLLTFTATNFAKASPKVAAAGRRGVLSTPPTSAALLATPAGDSLPKTAEQRTG
jgi:MFS family permease